MKTGQMISQKKQKYKPLLIISNFPSSFASEKKIKIYPFTFSIFFYRILNCSKRKKNEEIKPKDVRVQCE
jgi:hypothetical protein